MRTRCPACQSVFRVTSEQLQMKAGKVRCGHCHAVFDALESILEEPARLPAEEASQTQTQRIAPVESAREAGLVAARELSETPAFNRWAAGTMAADGSIGLDLSPAPGRSRRWLGAAVALLLILVAQALYHFRADIVALEPAAAPVFAALHIDVPRPAHGELVAIESTELRANSNGAGILLAATLKNRAAYVQAWPQLELTLTDANDEVVVRRILVPADYLLPERLEDGFPANGEIAVKLLLDAGDLPATAYSLYAFYP